MSLLNCKIIYYACYKKTRTILFKAIGHNETCVNEAAYTNHFLMVHLKPLPMDTGYQWKVVSNIVYQMQGIIEKQRSIVSGKVMIMILIHCRKPSCLADLEIYREFPDQVLEDKLQSMSMIRFCTV